VRIETGVEESNGDTTPSEVRVGVDAGRRDQELLLVARVDRKRREQFGLEGSQTTCLNSFFNGAMNTLWANTILRLPVRMIFAQNARDVIFELGLDGKKVWVERTVAEWAEYGMVH
jgi:hypothetical protein